MSKRPARRTTSLSNPLIPHQQDTEQPKTRAAEAMPKGRGAGTSWTRTSFKHTVEEGRRARGAWFYTQPQLGQRPYWQFVQEAVNEKVARLEAEYNHGHPFPNVDAVTPGPKAGSGPTTRLK